MRIAQRFSVGFSAQGHKVPQGRLNLIAYVRHVPRLFLKSPSGEFVKFGKRQASLAGSS